MSKMHHNSTTTKHFLAQLHMAQSSPEVEVGKKEKTSEPMVIGGQ